MESLDRVHAEVHADGEEVKGRERGMRDGRGVWVGMRGGWEGRERWIWGLSVVVIVG